MALLSDRSFSPHYSCQTVLKVRGRHGGGWKEVRGSEENACTVSFWPLSSPVYPENTPSLRSHIDSLTVKLPRPGTQMSPTTWANTRLHTTQMQQIDSSSHIKMAVKDRGTYIPIKSHNRMRESYSQRCIIHVCPTPYLTIYFHLQNISFVYLPSHCRSPPPLWCVSLSRGHPCG